MRTYQITDNRITLYRLVEFHNHSKPHWRARYVKSFMLKTQWIKRVIAMAWKMGIL